MKRNKLASILPAIRMIALVFIISMLGFLVTSCSNMRWGVNAGVDVRFGPNGPQVVPNVSVDAWSGGRW